MKKLILIIILALVILTPHRTSAGGGRFSITTIGDGDATVGGGIEVRARVTMPNDPDTLSIGEHAEYRILNPRSGDRCDTTDGFTDVNGYLHGNCTASTEGNYVIYVHSNDKGDDSSQYILYFYPPPTPTATPTTIPTVTSKPLPTSTPKLTTASVTKTTVTTPTKTPTALTQSTNADGVEPTPERMVEQNSSNLSPNHFIIIASAILSTLLLAVAAILVMHLRWKSLHARNEQINPVNGGKKNFSPLLE